MLIALKRPSADVLKAYYSCILGDKLLFGFFHTVFYHSEKFVQFR